MLVGLTKGLERPKPALVVTCGRDDFFQAGPITSTHELQCCASAIDQGFRNSLECHVQVVYPVQCIEGDDEIELLPIPHRQNVADMEVDVRPIGAKLSGSGNHARGGIDSDHASRWRDAIGKLHRDGAVATSDIEDPLMAFYKET